MTQHEESEEYVSAHGLTNQLEAPYISVLSVRLSVRARLGQPWLPSSLDPPSLKSSWRTLKYGVVGKITRRIERAGLPAHAKLGKSSVFDAVSCS